MTQTFNVLFLCTGNSARSIMAESIINQVGAGKFVGFSAGSEPKGAVHPKTIALLERLDYSTEGLRSKSWDEFSTDEAPKMDFVFTVCDKAAAETCPVWPGQPMTAHWGVPDPCSVTDDELTQLAAFREAYRLLHRRIELFVALPFSSLSKLSLKKELDEIGQAQASEE